MSRPRGWLALLDRPQAHREVWRTKPWLGGEPLARSLWARLCLCYVCYIPAQGTGGCFIWYQSTALGWREFLWRVWNSGRIVILHVQWHLYKIAVCTSLRKQFTRMLVPCYSFVVFLVLRATTECNLQGTAWKLWFHHWGCMRSLVVAVVRF